MPFSIGRPFVVFLKHKSNVKDNSFQFHLDKFDYNSEIAPIAVFDIKPEEKIVWVYDSTWKKPYFRFKLSGISS